MRVHFTGRHVEVTPALEQLARERLEKLQKLLPTIIEAHVILGVEKYRHQAEVNILTRRFSLSGARTTGDMYTSIGQVFETLERQAKKRKEKVTSRKRRSPLRRASPAPAASGEPPVPDGEGGAAPRRLVRTEPLDLKPMSVEDAVLQIQDSEPGFLVFRNSRSQRVNVVYRRSDGRFGIIEP